MQTQPQTSFTFLDTEICVLIHYRSSPGVRNDIIDSVILMSVFGDKELGQKMFDIISDRYVGKPACDWPRERHTAVMG